MLERDNIIFYDTSDLTETGGICGRANAAYLASGLKKRFPGEGISVTGAEINRSGIYRRGLTRIKNLPPYVSVQLKHCTGRHTETVTIWSPLAWNDRFFGTGGGGTADGGEKYITRPNNTSRGMTVAFAVRNGFTAATTDAGNPENEWALDRDTHRADWERIENWRSASTHFMTRAGKAVAELLHKRPVRYAYFHGGSGGGRQAMVEVQEHPEDYNGVWASCPAIYWSRFLPLGLWQVAVMNSANHVIPPRKMRCFMQAAWDKAGGERAYYQQTSAVKIAPLQCVGMPTKDGPITKEDAAVMKEIWEGPRDENGRQLWFGHRPGVLCWNVGIPVGAFYYTLFRKKPKPFFLSEYYLRWVTENPRQRFADVTLAEYRRLHLASIEKFSAADADKADLSAFANAGGKLMIDHGTDDPLIPVDGTLHYFRNVEAAMGRDVVSRFLRLYITPGDGHGSCSWHGPGISERDGVAALIAWVERGIAPKAIRTVQVDKRGRTLREAECFSWKEEEK